MRPQLRLGTVAGIDVRMGWGAVAMLSLLGAALAFGGFPHSHPGRPVAAYLMSAALAVLLFTASVLAHELAHALASRAHGVRVERITLWLLGGLAQTRGALPTPRAELLVALAGPATSLALTAGFGALAGLLAAAAPAGLAATVAGYLALTNLTLTALNLIPATPLDGGRILHAAVWRVTGDEARATRVAGRAGRWIGATLIALGALVAVAGAGRNGVWLLLLGVFVTEAAMAEESADALGRRLAGMTVAEVMTPYPVTAVPSAWLAAFIDNTVLQRPFSTYPLVDLDGRLAGLVTLNRIRAVPAERRWWTRLGDIAIPPTDVVTAGPDEPLADLVARIGPGSGDNRAVVVNDRGQVIGVVSPTDLARAAILADLRAGTATTPEPEPSARPTPRAGTDRLLPA